VGSIVDFPNEDPWFHNVFSLYRESDLIWGCIKQASHRSVTFDRIGPSYLFCNIHPEMTGVVLAIDSDLFSLSDKKRTLHTSREWRRDVMSFTFGSENATAESLQTLQPASDHTEPRSSSAGYPDKGNKTRAGEPQE